MGRMSFFMTFKKGTKEDLYECLNLIGKERFNDNEVFIVDIITMKKSILDFKKGKSYLRTSGQSYSHVNKTFLEGVKGLRKNQCTIINDEIYWVFGDPIDLKDVADIESIEYKDGSYQCFEITEEDKMLEEKYNIERVIGGYRKYEYSCNSNEVEKSNELLKLINTDRRSDDYRYIYYDFDYSRLEDGNRIILTNLCSGYNDRLAVYAQSQNDSGYMYFDLPENEILEPTAENIKLVCNSIASLLKEKGLKDINIQYALEFNYDDFKEYKKEHLLSI